MSDIDNVYPVPKNPDNKVMKTTVTPSRYQQFVEACDRLNIPNPGVFTFMAIEEKLQRDCPDLHKNRKKS
jgi:hypothetical protein